MVDYESFPHVRDSTPLAETKHPYCAVTVDDNFKCNKVAINKKISYLGYRDSSSATIMQLAPSILLYPWLVITTFVNGNYQNPHSAVNTKIDYNEFKKDVSNRRSLLINHPAKDIRNYLFKLINEDIYNYWAGTPWDFYGTTRQPKTGTIACGFFVTNTLTDLGFKIDRMGLANAASAVMIKQLCVGVRSFHSLDKLNNYLATQPVNSAFIIGLDFHTGYVVKTAAGCYFFHSNYINKQGVIKEKIMESKALSTNKYFMIGSLTANESLLQKWVADKPVI